MNNRHLIVTLAALPLILGAPAALADHARVHKIKMALCAKIQSSKDYPLVKSDDWYKVKLQYTAGADRGGSGWTDWGSYGEANKHIENKGRWNGNYTSSWGCTTAIEREIWGGTGTDHQWKSGKLVVSDGKDMEFNLYQIYADGHRKVCVVGQATWPVGFTWSTYISNGSC